MLQPDGQGAATTEIHLSPDDSGRRIGPFPAGNYTVSLVAAAVRPDKHHVPVSIASNGTHDLNFTLQPDGMVYGHVVTAQNAEDRPGGMPAEQYLPGSKKVTIQMVALKGAGIERILHPAEGENLNTLNALLSSTDYCRNDYFHFFGLPAGEYEVKITAKGCRPSLKTYVVKPGRQAGTRVTELSLE